MIRRIKNETYDGFPLWAWLFILPGIVIVAALVIRRLRDQARLTPAASDGGQEFRIEDRRHPPQTAEQTKYAPGPKESAAPLGTLAYMEVMENGAESAEAAEMKSSTIAAEAEVAEDASEPEQAKDDLKIVEGIGPKIEALLKKAGIGTYRALSTTSVERLHEVLREAGLYMVDPNTWPEQARLAANESWDFLKAMQDRTNAGRRSIEG